MRLPAGRWPRLSTLLLPLAAGCALVVAPSAAADCKTLLDWDAPLFSALPLLLDVTLEDLQALHVDKALAPVDELYPAFSRCIASGDLVGAALPIVTGQSDQQQCLTDITGMASGSSGLSAASLESQLCPLVNNTLLPCVDSVVNELLMAFFASATECCAEFQSQVTDSLGQSLESFIAVVIELLANVLCSVQTQASGETRTCASAWVASLGTERVMVEATKMVQLADDQVCAAMTGSPVETTTGQTYQFFESTSAVDSCFAPVDLMLRNLSRLPFVTSSSEAQALFANATGTTTTDAACLSGLTILNDARDPDGAVAKLAAGIDAMAAALHLTDNSTDGSTTITRTMDRGFANLEGTVGALCLHFAQTPGDCAYSSALQFAYASGDGASGIEPSGGSSSASNGAPSKLGAAVSSLVLLPAAVAAALAMR